MADYDYGSLVNISYDNYTVEQGSVSQSSSGMTLESNSRCRFNYYYDGGKISSSTFRVVVALGNNQNITRYNDKVKVNIKIQYYNKSDSSYNDGNWKSVDIILGKQQTIEQFIDNSSSDIKSIVVRLVNKTSSNINFYFVHINKEVVPIDLNSEEFQEALDDNFEDNIAEHENSQEYQDRLNEQIVEKSTEVVEQYITLSDTRIDVRENDPASPLNGQIWIKISDIHNYIGQ